MPMHFLEIHSAIQLPSMVLRGGSLLFSRIGCPVIFKFLNSLTEIYFIYHTAHPFKAYGLMAFSIALPSLVEFQSGFWEYSGCFLWKTIQLGSVVHSECLVHLELSGAWRIQLRSPLALLVGVNRPEDSSFCFYHIEGGKKDWVSPPENSAYWRSGLWFLVSDDLAAGKEVIQGTGAMRALERMGYRWEQLWLILQGVRIESG